MSIVITSAYNFTDADSPSVFYRNPHGTSVTSADICIEADNTEIIAYRPIDKTLDEYVFHFTNDEVNALRMANTMRGRGVYFTIRTNINGDISYDRFPVELSTKESEDVLPSATVTVSVNNGTVPSAFGSTIIQNKSSVSVSVSPEAKYGATIDAVKIFCNGKEYEGTNAVIPVTWNRTFSICVLVKDSRGFHTTVTQSKYSYPYDRPHLKNTECYRNDNGKIFLRTVMDYFPVNSINECNLMYRTKEYGQESYTFWQQLATINDSYENILPISISDSSAYLIEIKAIDRVGEEEIVSFNIPVNTTTVHLAPGGKAIGIGQMAEDDDTVTVAWKTKFKEGIIGILDNIHMEGSILSYAEEMPYGFAPFVSASDAPSGFINGYIQKSQNACQIVMHNNQNQMAINSYLNGTWSGWRII